MARLRDILKSVTISATAGSDYATLNDAVAGSSINTYTVEGDIALTANITFPANSTLIIGTQGKVSGAYTLTGNNTVIVLEGDNYAVGNDITFAGTWVCKSVHVDNFGTVADGGTDDYISISKAISFCKLTKSKELHFRQLTYRCNTTIDLTGLTVHGNNAKIVCASGVLVVASGAVGTSYNLSGNAYVGDSWLKCNDATLLNSITNGDLVKVISNEIIQPLSNENTRAGEIHEVRSVDLINGYIYFNDYLFYSYSTSDSARVAKITYANLVMNNISLIVESETVATHAALIAKGIKNLVLDNVSAKGYYAAISLHDCYSPLLRVKTFQSDQTGIGYGVQIGGSCMNSNIQGVFVGARHCVTTGNGGIGTGNDAGGISWNSKVHDSIGFAGLSSCTVFDTHASSGSIYYDNCVAIGGVFRDKITLITDWNTLSTYSVNSLVRSSLKNLYRASIENTNKNPDTDIAGNWVEDWGHASQAGFKSEGLNQYYTDCKIFGCVGGINLTAVSGNRTKIKNLEAYGCNAVIPASTTSCFKELDVDGITAQVNTVGTALYMLGKIDKWSFSNIKLTNTLLFGASITTAVLPKSLTIDNFSVIFEDAKATSNYAVSTLGLFEDITLSNGEITNANFLKLSLNATGSNIDSVCIFNVRNTNPKLDVITIEHTVNNLIINGLLVKNPTTSNYLISTKKSMQNLSISNSAYIGTNATKLIFTYLAETLGTFSHNNNIFPNLTTIKTGSGALASLEVTGGSIGALRSISGFGIPEGAVAATIGTKYTRLDGGTNTTLYVKESGVGNTGWIAK